MNMSDEYYDDKIKIKRETIKWIMKAEKLSKHKFYDKCDWNYIKYLDIRVNNIDFTNEYILSLILCMIRYDLWKKILVYHNNTNNIKDICELKYISILSQITNYQCV